jgi:hypothetical protein
MQKKLVTEKIPVHLLEAGNSFKLGGTRHIITFVAGHEDYSGNHDGRYDITCYPKGTQFETLTTVVLPSNTMVKVRRFVVKYKEGEGWMSLQQYRRRKANDKRRRAVIKQNKKRRGNLDTMRARAGVRPFPIEGYVGDR